MKVKSIAEINPPAASSIDRRSFIDYIDTAAVSEGRLNSVQHLNTAFPSRAQREVHTDDILISSVRPNLMHNFFVTQNENGMIASTGFVHLRVKQGSEIVPRFLYYYLTMPSKISYYTRIANCSQSAYPSFSKEVIENIEVPNVPVPIQLRIAGILGSLDEKIELNRRKIIELESLAKTIYDYWFVQFDFPDGNGHPYKSSGGTMKWSEDLNREIPKGWDVVDLPTIAEYLFGFPFDSSLFNTSKNGVPIIRIRNVNAGFTADYTTENADSSYVISDGDFLIGMDGYFDMNHWVGGDAYLVQRTCRVKAKDPLYSGWLSFSLYSPIKHLEKSLSGATLAHLGKAHLDKIKFPFPPPQETQCALELLNYIIQRKVSLGKENIQLISQRNALLPLLMNGQVKVAE